MFLFNKSKSYFTEIINNFIFWLAISFQYSFFNDCKYWIMQTFFEPVSPNCLSSFLKNELKYILDTFVHYLYV